MSHAQNQRSYLIPTYASRAVVHNLRKVTRVYIAFVLVLICSNVYSQTDYYKIRKKKLNTISIDTTNTKVLILVNKNARMYFQQSDLLDYIEFSRKNGNSTPFTFEEKFEDLFSLLNSGKHRIVLNDWWYSYTDQDRQKLLRNREYTNSEEKYVNELQHIGSDLLIYGKFMIYERSEGKFIEKGLIVKRVKGIMGGESLYFYLPSKQYFWTVLLSLGE